ISIAHARCSPPQAVRSPPAPGLSARAPGPRPRFRPRGPGQGGPRPRGGGPPQHAPRTSIRSRLDLVDQVSLAGA
ncbi:MAG: hypothetical protein ABSC21_24085, partial [Terriglobia bacterium]